ncbi:MAG: 3-dehydroquinate synthase [Gammaproteobacteria bacterium]|nr:3-dehydroquinate synthase [Gammaproteobacteria bacterium]
MSEHNQVTVNLGERSYDIHIRSSLLDDVSLIAGAIHGPKAVIVTNDTLEPMYARSLCKKLSEYKEVSIIKLPDGESYKTLDTLNLIFTQLLEERHDRSTTLIALGGGVVGDMTGFAAACYQRGVNFIQVPTTLLSQVDSSVGGKTGVNHPLGKNMIGAFKQPVGVFIDTSVLATLPDREFSAGMAEVVKYGLIWDHGFFEWLEANSSALSSRDAEALSYAIRRSCEIKAEVVASDETEKGQRAILNLGHTFGHAIETHFGYGHYLHGEAVAIGMKMAITLSLNLGSLDEKYLYRLDALLKSFGLPTNVPAEMTPECFFEHMSVDKKVSHGQIRFVVLVGKGEAEVTSNVNYEAVCSAIMACTE